MSETLVRARLNENGRIVIPAVFREALGLSPGDEVLLRLEEDGVKVSGVRQALARARALVKTHVKSGEDLTQSLIADRRREAKRE
jgi:AbrB family looped-hinge helix DNA binding protein